MTTVLFAGGGSAGHVNPLLATAHTYLQRHPDDEVICLGVASGLETQLVPAAGFELVTIPKVPLPRRPNWAAVQFPRKFAAAISQVRELIRTRNIDLVVGFGGYVSTPAYLAALREHIPVAIHEQNARPGYANRLGARRAELVALTFASTPLQAKRGRTVVTGLPLAGPILDLACRRRAGDQAWARTQAATALGLNPTLTTIVITGGSLGAQSLNRTLVELADDFQAHNAQVLHLTGQGKDAQVRAELERRGTYPHYHVRDYLPDMHLAYAAADMVVCRAGAGTVAELSAVGLPALYVPLPIGNGEQAKNAADVIAAKGGKLLDDDQLTAARVRHALTEWITDAEIRETTAQRAASVGSVQGARTLVDELEKIRP
ncbi:MAG: undecaprenyldiphospho-muramoylpentapeptide beta-N-acetylglucosaminyltransferase [Bowdeniella nasicola]|nr:undecaprenyldiphospho-muramoylpentapeptide beta-N-acetylglucosaminyltransferase [Bowdeniella nasicola]